MTSCTDHVHDRPSRLRSRRGTSAEIRSDRQGLVVFRANQLKALLDALKTLLRDFPPASVLTPQTVVAAHPGMKQWLMRALAWWGAGGSGTNLDVTLPSRWIDA